MHRKFVEEDAIELIDMIENIRGKIKKQDKDRFETLLGEIRAFHQSYTPDVSIQLSINRMENFFKDSVAHYQKFAKKPGFLKGNRNYMQELNRGGGSSLDRAVGLMLKNNIYPSSKYAAVPLILVDDINQLKDKRSLFSNPFRRKGP